MNKKIIKYISRLLLGLFTVLWGLLTWVALLPPMDEYPCEAGQEDMSPYWFILITAVSFITFCIVWNNTRKWPKDEIKKYKTKAEKEQELHSSIRSNTNFGYDQKVYYYEYL